jgi:alpha-N-acetylglucosaminidase
VISNEAIGAARAASGALAHRDRPAFDAASARLLGLGTRAEALLAAEPEFRLATHQRQALAYGRTDAERAGSLRDAMALVTYWAGDDRRKDELHDYAFKAWSGMMDSYSMGRWRAYFGSVDAHWGEPSAPLPDFFAWERRWAAAHSDPAMVPSP